MSLRAYSMAEVSRDKIDGKTTVGFTRSRGQFFGSNGGATQAYSEW